LLPALANATCLPSLEIAGDPLAPSLSRPSGPKLTRSVAPL
jgi:hypothetical protein